MKRLLSVLCLAVLLASSLTAAAPIPNVTFTLLQELPATMNVGETYTVMVRVDSDQPFLFAQAMPSFYYPGRGVVSVQGGDRVRNATTATLAITYKAKTSTAKMPDGLAPVYFIVGVRYAGGYTVVQEFVFNVAVP
jgi:hypothetical protein